MSPGTNRPAETKAAQLNKQTPKTTRCHWPGCDRMYATRNPATGQPVYDRVAVLCWHHAGLVADAVLEERLLTADFMHHEVTHEKFDAERRADDRERRETARTEAASQLRGDRPGFVYYLQVGDRIKVGYSTDVRKRMRAYPPGSKLLAVEPGSLELEAQRHRELVGSLLDGREWFRPDSVVLEHIRRIADQHSDGRQFAHHFRSNRGQMQKVRRA